VRAPAALAALALFAGAPLAHASEANGTGTGAATGDASPSFGVTRSTDYVEIFGGVTDVPDIVDAVRGFASDPRAPPTRHLVTITWLG